MAGGLDSQWSLSQTPEGTIRFRLKDATAAQRDASFALTADDPGRWMLLAATFSGGTMRLYKNGIEMATATYTAPPAAGVGNMYFGRFVSADGNGAQGDLGHVAIWATVALTAAQIYSLAVAGTWTPGGLDVALAMTEPRQAQDWLAQIFQMRGMRLGRRCRRRLYADARYEPPAMSSWTFATPRAMGSAISSISRRATARALPDAVSELVLKYRRDLVTGTLLAECRRVVSAHGKEHVIESDVIRDHTTADRVAHYLAARMITDETVEATVVQDGVQVLEGHRVTLTDTDTGYSGETLEVLEVQKQLDQVTLVLGEHTRRPLYVCAGHVADRRGARMIRFVPTNLVELATATASSEDAVYVAANARHPERPFAALEDDDDRDPEPRDRFRHGDDVDRREREPDPRELHERLDPGERHECVGRARRITRPSPSRGRRTTAITMGTASSERSRSGFCGSTSRVRRRRMARACIASGASGRAASSRRRAISAWSPPNASTSPAKISSPGTAAGSPGSSGGSRCIVSTPSSSSTMTPSWRRGGRSSGNSPTRIISYARARYVPGGSVRHAADE